MITTANLTELQKLLQAECGDPHHILGMHEISSEKGDFIAVRVFIPNAKSIVIIDDKNPSLRYESNLIHEDGFFEAIILDRKTWFKYKLEITNYEGCSWTSYDPYSFRVLTSEMDLFLFGEGTHYEIYNKLGANPMIADEVEGVLFVIWAPNAFRVSVIGDFNNWDGRRNQMRLLKKSGVWELFIPGLKDFDRYKYEIRTASGEIIEKSDPYAKFSELRPSTVSLVYDINNYTWNDEEWIDKRKQEKTTEEPMNIYELHFGSWKKPGDNSREFLTYVELADELIPYLKEMSYTHIELLPITEYPYDGSWGYQVTGYYSPTSRYGSPDEFMYFIDMCHKNNIGVILDWVPGHFPKDSHGLGRFDGSALYEHQDPRIGEHKEWGTYIFNFGRKEVKNFLIGSAVYWIDKYHIDGIRVDAVASMIYLDFCKNPGEWIPNAYGGNENIEAIEFIKHLNSIVNKTRSGVLMIAEESTDWQGVTKPAEYGGLGFNLKWNMGWMNDVLFYFTKDYCYRKYHQSNITFGLMYAHTEKFILVLSHDEVVHGKYSLLSKMPGDLWQKFASLRSFYGFMYGHPGKKLLFMGGEFGQFIEWDEKRSLDWFLLDYEHHKAMLKFVKDLNKLYLEDIPLSYDDNGFDGFEWINCNDNKRSLLTFFRKSLKEITIFICNFTPATIENYRMGVPIEAGYKEILNSDNKIYGGSGVVNGNIIDSEKIFWDNRENSISLRVAPLSVTILKPVL